MLLLKETGLAEKKQPVQKSAGREGPREHGGGHGIFGTISAPPCSQFPGKPSSQYGWGRVPLSISHHELENALACLANVRRAVAMRRSSAASALRKHAGTRTGNDFP